MPTAPCGKEGIFGYILLTICASFINCRKIKPKH